MKSDKDLINSCTEAGAYRAGVLTTDKIPFDENLRSYCEVNYCGNYGKNYACPPSVGDENQLIAKAKNYKKALVFQTVAQIEDSFDYEGMKEAELRHSKIADKINKYIKKQFDDYLQLSAGKCSVCPVCAQIGNKPCRFPDKAISSLEAYCMNVSALAKLCSMNYIKGKNILVLLFFGNNLAGSHRRRKRYSIT